MITTAIRLRYDFDVSRMHASIRSNSTRAKMNMSIFHRSRIAVELNAYRNSDQFHCSRMRRGTIVS